MDYRYLGQMVAGIKGYAGTGMLACQSENQLCRLYYRLGELTHAELGKEVGVVVLARLLSWKDVEIEFFSREESEARSLQPDQEEIFLQALGAHARSGILEKWYDHELELLPVPALSFVEDVISAELVDTILTGEIESGPLVLDTFEGETLVGQNPLEFSGIESNVNPNSLEVAPELDPVSFDFKLPSPSSSYYPPVQKTENIFSTAIDEVVWSPFELKTNFGTAIVNPATNVTNESANSEVIDKFDNLFESLISKGGEQPVILPRSKPHNQSNS